MYLKKIPFLCSRQSLLLARFTCDFFHFVDKFLRVNIDMVVFVITLIIIFE